MPPPRATSPAVPATWDRVLAWRLARHHLDRAAIPMAAPPRGAPMPTRGAGGLVPLVRRLSGVHAQLASAAEAAVWLRTGGAVGPDDVRRALAVDRTLVKTWAVRGTLHLLPAEDLPLWSAALGTRSFPRPQSWYRYHGVSPEDMAAIEETVPQVLSATPVTREQLAREVAARVRRPHLEQRLLSGWGAVLKPLAARGELAFGPPHGQSVTFVAPRKWLATWVDVAPDEAVAEVLRRYLGAYGPASLDDLYRWSALDKPVLRRALKAMGGELAELDTEGHRGWLTRESAADVAATEPSRLVRLLPGFDPYVVGALNQLEHLIRGPYRDQVSRTSGWISPVLVDGGRIVGTWRQEIRGGRLELAVAPFERLPRGMTPAVEAEAERWAAYAGSPLALSWD